MNNRFLIENRVQLNRIINRVCRRLNITIRYYSAYGMKAYNAKFAEPIGSENCITVNPEQLYLGVDYLRDRYTLMGTSIVASPHIELMKCLERHGELRDTEYIIRMIKGCLDERDSITAYLKAQNYFKECYEKCKESVLQDSYVPVKVYQVGEQMYILDGKHRAACCAMLGLPVRCELLKTQYCKDPYLLAIAGKKEYSRHTAFLSMLDDLN